MLDAPAQGEVALVALFDVVEARQLSEVLGELGQLVVARVGLAVGHDGHEVVEVHGAEVRLRVDHDGLVQLKVNAHEVLQVFQVHAG